MIKIAVIIFFVVYLNTGEITAISGTDSTDIFHRTNDKILKITDDLFISLKISKNFTKSQNAEKYNKRHSLVQNVLCKNHKRYKQIRDIIETRISNKITHYILNINEVIEEMIRETTQNYRNETTRNDTVGLNDVEDFVHIARRFNFQIKTIAATAPKLLGTEADKEEGRRIFEGSNTGIARYPFMVSVHLATRFVCAGSLLHESLALSVASCLMRTVETKEHVHIRVASDFVSKMGSLVDIGDVIFHPGFDQASLVNNLALLQTKNPLRFRKQTVVAIQYDRLSTTVLRSDVQDLIILGWGRRRADDSDLRQEDRPLSEAHLQLYDFDACQYIYTRDFVTDKCFCAGFSDRGGGACNHDAGGPAIVNNVLVGVISFGSPQCGATEAPTVFTRLGLYADWIDGVFRELNEVQGIKPKDQLDIVDNVLREDITDVDQALKEVYKENFNVDEVLYGPIDRHYDEELANIPTKTNLREYPIDPALFPNPELVANIPTSQTIKPFEPPKGYWKDWSEEPTYNPINEDKLPLELSRELNKLKTKEIKSTQANEAVDEMPEEHYELQDIYISAEDETSTSKYTTEANEGQFYVQEHTEIHKSVTSYAPEMTLVKISEKKWFEIAKGSVLREADNNTSTMATYKFTKLFGSPSANTATRKPNKSKETPKVHIDNTIEDDRPSIIMSEDDRAVIFMSDSGTTNIIKMKRKDHLYERFKLLAAKAQVVQAQDKA